MWYRKYLYDQRKIKTWQVFILIILLNGLLLAVMRHNVRVDLIAGGLPEMQQKILSPDTSADLIDSIYLYSLIFLPAVLAVKYVFLSLLLQMVYVVRFKNLAFGKSLRIILIASVSQVLAGFARVLYPIRLVQNPHDSIHEQIPFGIAAFFDQEIMSAGLFFVINQINVFEATWCLIIYSGLSYWGVEEKFKIKQVVILFWMGIVLFQVIYLLIFRDFAGL